MGNLGGRWETAFGSKLLTRKTGRVETSDTVEDKNKNVYIVTGQLKLKHICAIFGGTLRITVPLFQIFFFGGGRVPLSPRDLRPCPEIFELPTNSHVFLHAPGNTSSFLHILFRNLIFYFRPPLYSYTPDGSQLCNVEETRWTKCSGRRWQAGCRSDQNSNFILEGWKLNRGVPRD